MPKLKVVGGFEPSSYQEVACVGFPSTNMTRTSLIGAKSVESKPPAIFGFVPSQVTLPEAVSIIIGPPRSADQGVGLVVTPNIDHIFQLEHKPPFRTAYEHAALILCDGFPIYYYALARGHRVHHITGCDLTSRLLSIPHIAPHHKLFFVVDSIQTEEAVDAWASGRDLSSQISTLVPPYGFGDDEAWCTSAAAVIRAFQTTILIMAVGASQSEVFVDQHRTELPPCWAICVGQAVKVELRLVTRAPRLFRRLHTEWLWRLMQEPVRLIPRYTFNSLSFIPSMLTDIKKNRDLA